MFKLLLSTIQYTVGYADQVFSDSRCIYVCMILNSCQFMSLTWLVNTAPPNFAWTI